MGPQAALVLFFTLGAVATGFLRELAVAAVYATSATADAFALMFLYVEGVYAVMTNSIASQVLVPLFINADTEGRAARREILWGLVVWIALLGTPLAVGAAIWPMALATILAPGFSPSQLDALRPLLVVAIPTCMLLAAGGVLSGGLRSESQFIAPLVGRAAFSLVTGATVIVLGRRWGAWAGAAGLVGGAFIQFLVQWWRLHAIGWAWMRPRMSHTHLGHFLRMVWPVLAASLLLYVFMGGAQRALASDLPTGAFAITNYAQRLLSLASLISASLYTVAATDFSTGFREGGQAALRRQASTQLNSLAYILTSMSVVMMLTSRTLVSLAFERGNYPASAVVETGHILWIFCLSLLPGGIAVLFHAIYTAAGRPSLVFVTSAIMVAATLGSTWLLRPWLGTSVLAVAYAIGMTVFAISCLVFGDAVLSGGTSAAFGSYVTGLLARVAASLAIPAAGLSLIRGWPAASAWLLGDAGAVVAIGGAAAFVAVFVAISWWSRDAGFDGVRQAARATHTALRRRLSSSSPA